MSHKILKLDSFYKDLLFILIFSFFAFSLKAAWLEDIPARLTQPDGTQIEVLRSGDEFHNWIHDENGFTVVQDPETGYWCWGRAENGNLISTGFPIHLNTAESLGLNPRENISEERYLQKRDWFMDELNRSSVRSPSTGIVYSIVVFIRFSDDTEFGEEALVFEEMFHGHGENVNSMFQYFWDASYNQLEVYSPFFPVPDNDWIVSYQSPLPRSYFQPYNAVTNPNGYQDWQRQEREHALLRDAIIFIHDQVPVNLAIDANNDGYVDNVNFMIRGSSDDWAELLWPHRWALFTYFVTLHGKRVWDFNFNIETFTYNRGIGVLAHEFAHSLSLPDFYRYSDNTINPIGRWCLMASDNNPPQSVSAYSKWKYTDWTYDLPRITLNGTYTLNPVSTHYNEHAYRINSPYSSRQFYVVEYRSSAASFIDSNLWGSGLLVYRVNNLLEGNSQGPPDELYVYRPDGTLNINGNIESAAFSQQTGRTAINEFTNPMPFLENSQYGGLDISDIGFAGETISFYANIHINYDFFAPTDLTANAHIEGIELFWTALDETVGNQPNHLGYRVYRNGLQISQVLEDSQFFDSEVNIYIENKYYVVSVYELGDSKPSEILTVLVDFPFPIRNLTSKVLLGTTVILEWEAPEVLSDALIGYRIVRYDEVFSENVILTADNFLELEYEDYVEFAHGCNTFRCEYTIIAVYTFGESEPVKTEEWLGTGSDDDDIPLALKTELIGNFPNPFNPETVITFSVGNAVPYPPSQGGIKGGSGGRDAFMLSESIHIQIDIFNIRGQKIRTLLDDYLEIGQHSVVWNGLDDFGRDMGSGLYFYQMKTDDFVSVKRMVLLK